MFDFFSSTMFRYIGRVFRNPMGWVPYLMVKKWMILVYSTGIVSLYIIITNKAVQEKLVIAENVLVEELDNAKSIAQNCTTFVANAELDKLWQCLQHRPKYIPTEFDNKIFSEWKEDNNTKINDNEIQLDSFIYKNIINELNTASSNSHDTVVRLKNKMKQLYGTSDINLNHSAVNFELNRDLLEKELDESYKQVLAVKKRITKDIVPYIQNNKELLNAFNKEIELLTYDLNILLQLASDNLAHQESTVLFEESTTRNNINRLTRDLEKLTNTDNSATQEKNIDEIDKLEKDKQYFENEIYNIEKKKQAISNKKSKLKERIDAFNADME